MKKDTSTTSDEVKKADSEQTKTQQLWVFDPIQVSAAKIDGNNIMFQINWIDFIGDEHLDTVSRLDCYFKFPQVLQALVTKGYRYNTMIVEAPMLIQQVLTSFRPSPEVVKQAKAKIAEAKSETK